MNLMDLRGRIDAVDERLVELFCERMRLAGAAGVAKSRLGLPLSDDAREQEISARAAQMAGKKLAPYARQFCKALFTIAKEYQVHQSVIVREPEKEDEPARK